MKILIAAAIVLALPTSVSASESVSSVADKLTTIASPGLGKRKAVEKRFRFILPAFVKHCSDVEQPVKAADMMVVVYKHIDEAGLAYEEDLFELANGLYSMTMQISPWAQRANIPLRCAEIWAMHFASSKKWSGSR